jgi:DNA-binding transcriptional ArsR family regulator
MAILDVLRERPATITQIAASLGVHPANLTRHIRVLEDAGLVALVEKRDTGRNLEKYYAAAARRFRIAPETATLTAPHKIALTFARSELSAALVRLPDETTDPVTALALRASVEPGMAKAFAEELAGLAERFSAADRGAGQTFQLVLALYPADADVSDERRSIRLARGKERRR